jgi:hypothetical protein
LKVLVAASADIHHAAKVSARNYYVLKFVQQIYCVESLAHAQNAVTALFAAARAGKMDALQYLLSLGASVMVKAEVSKSKLFTAICSVRA